jgi:tetratricopeptide (TPR) repeat protein
MKKWMCFLLAGLILAVCQAQDTRPTSEAAVESGAPTPQSSGTADTESTARAELPTTSQMTAGLVCGTLDERAAGYFNRGVNMQTSGDIEVAKNLYQQAIDLDPGYCDAMDNLGLLLRQDGDLQGAIEWYLRSIEVAPHNTVARMNLAVAYDYQGKVELAIEQYEQIVMIDPENPEGYYGLAGIYMRQEQYENAVLLYEEAARLYEKDNSFWARDAYYGLGLSLAGLNRCEEAVKHLERIYDEFIYDPWVNYALGACYFAEPLSDLPKADQYLGRAFFLGMEIPPEIWTELPSLDLQIAEDVFINYGYFGIVVMDDQGGFFFPTDEVPYREGVEYGWMMVVDTSRTSLNWEEQFELPAPPQSWGTIEAGGFTTISADGRTAVTEGSTELVETVIGNSWLLERGDPLGAHEIRIYVEGEYVTTFEFVVGLAGESS